MSRVSNAQRPQIWDSVIPDEDRRIYEEAGFGTRRGFGARPCVLIIDVVGAFLGPRPGTPATRDDFMACGTMGWERLPNIVNLIDEARRAKVPVVFVKGSVMAKRFCGGSVKATVDPETSTRIHSVGFPNELQPAADEFILEKSRPSAFFGTPLTAYLNRLGIDTLIVAGTTTSGCVRASVIDGSSHNYDVIVVEECCFDRSYFSHVVNMYEMQQKYADIVNVQDVRQYFASLAAVPVTD